MSPNGAHVLWEEHSTCFLKTCGWQYWQPRGGWYCPCGHLPLARHIQGPECQPSWQQGTSHRGQDAGKKMHRLRGVKGADGWMSWVGKGQGRSPQEETSGWRSVATQGFREGVFQAKERAHANTNIFAHHILSLMPKKKERKSPIAFKYLLIKVLLLKFLRIQLSWQYKTYPPLFPFRTQPSHRPCCLPSSETPVFSVLLMSVSSSSVSIPYAKRSCVIYAKHDVFFFYRSQKNDFLLSFYFICLIIPVTICPIFSIPRNSKPLSFSNWLEILANYLFHYK